MFTMKSLVGLSLLVGISAAIQHDLYSRREHVLLDNLHKVFPRGVFSSHTQNIATHPNEATATTRSSRLAYDRPAHRYQEEMRNNPSPFTKRAAHDSIGHDTAFKVSVRRLAFAPSTNGKANADEDGQFSRGQQHEQPRLIRRGGTSGTRPPSTQGASSSREASRPRRPSDSGQMSSQERSANPERAQSSSRSWSTSGGNLGSTPGRGGRGSRSDSPPGSPRIASHRPDNSQTSGRRPGTTSETRSNGAGVAGMARTHASSGAAGGNTPSGIRRATNSVRNASNQARYRARMHPVTTSLICTGLLGTCAGMAGGSMLAHGGFMATHGAMPLLGGGLGLAGASGIPQAVVREPPSRLPEGRRNSGPRSNPPSSSQTNQGRGRDIEMTSPDSWSSARAPRRDTISAQGRPGLQAQNQPPTSERNLQRTSSQHLQSEDASESSRSPS